MHMQGLGSFVVNDLGDHSKRGCGESLKGGPRAGRYLLSQLARIGQS